jgi:hypothetical protein
MTSWIFMLDCQALTKVLKNQLVTYNLIVVIHSYPALPSFMEYTSDDVRDNFCKLLPYSSSRTALFLKNTEASYSQSECCAEQDRSQINPTRHDTILCFIRSSSSGTPHCTNSTASRQNKVGEQVSWSSRPIRTTP